MKKVDIQKIVDELQMRFMDTIVYYNKITGETLNVQDDDFRIVEDDDFENNIENYPEWQREHLKEVYDLLYNDVDNYIALPNYFEIKDSDIMEEFIETISNSNKRIQLENCMWQKGMYRKFKDKLIDIGLENDYYKFYDEKLKKIAIEWCKENNLEYEE
ncbi:MAG: UPF0158 family protein [Clostridia bacterium]